MRAGGGVRGGPEEGSVGFCMVPSPPGTTQVTSAAEGAGVRSEGSELRRTKRRRTVAWSAAAGPAGRYRCNSRYR